MLTPYGSGDEVWTIGYLFGTKQGAAPDGLPDTRPFGEMQDFSLKDSITLKQVMGASSLGPVAVGVSGRNVTGSAKWLKVRLRNLELLRGNIITYNSVTNVSNYTAGITDEPSVYDLHFMSGSLSAPDTEIKVYRCLSPEVTIPLAQRDFAIPDATVEVLGIPGVNGKFWEIFRPGNQMTS